MKNFFLLLALACCSLQSAAQTKSKSYWKIWQDESQTDINRLRAIYILADDYLYSKPDSALYLAQLMYEHAERSDQKKHMAQALNTQGLALELMGNYSRSLHYAQKSLKISQEIGDKSGIAIALSNIGLIYEVQGDYPRALDYYLRCLKIDEENDDKGGIASSMGNIGLIYLNQKDYPKALDYLQKSLKIAEEIDDKEVIAPMLNNIGIVYQKQGNYPMALDYYQRSLKLSEEIGDRNGFGNSLNNIGVIYDEQGNYSQAIDYHQRSIKVKEETGDKNGIITSLINVGGINHKQGNNQQAIQECNKSLLLAQEIGVIDRQWEACECLYDAYKTMGNGNKALEFHEKMLALDDSLQAEETAKQLQQMEFQKQVLADSIASAEEARLVEEAHKEELRQKKRTRNIFGGVGFFALLLAGGFYWRWRYVRKSKAVLQVEKDRSENLLLNILPEEIAEELKEKGRADARDFEMVSILFTDFKGFTAASEKLSAQDLVSEINTCFEAFDSIMGKYGIEKIKTIGDAYMAAGGLPVPTNDSVKNTVLAALEMQDFIRDRKAKLDAEGKPGFEMRVGVHTGPVVAGIVGVKKFQYDIWGDSVNTASRMESSGEVGKVNISEATYELLKDDPHFSFESRGKVEAKGKGEMEMYFVSQKG